MPVASVRVVLEKRDPKNIFREIWNVEIDPGDMFVDDSAPPDPGLIEIQRSGDPATKVDLLLLGDGYTAAECGEFERDARRTAEVLFSVSPFSDLCSDFNVWGLCPPAAASGVSRPSTGDRPSERPMTSSARSATC